MREQEKAREIEEKEFNGTTLKEKRNRQKAVEIMKRVGRFEYKVRKKK